MDLKTEWLHEIGAKYIFCLMRDTIARNQHYQDSVFVIPKYTIGWTDMEISGAPTTTTIPFCFLSGTEIVRIHTQLIDLHLIEKM